MRYTEAPARRAELLRRLQLNGYISSALVATELAVSEMTIRRDLAQLCAAGLANRVVGGASFVGERGVPFEQRNRADTHAKRAIAAACAPLLTGAATVALDAGTTVAPLAELLAPGTTVISHSVPVLVTATTRNDVDVIGIGGLYQPDTRSFAGPPARSAVEGLSADIVVLSATAVDASGVFCANPLDAEMKRSLARIGTRVILLADQSKLLHRARIRVGDLSLIDTLVTDALTPQPTLESLRSAGVQVVVAAASDHEESR